MYNDHEQRVDDLTHAQVRALACQAGITAWKDASEAALRAILRGNEKAEGILG